MDLDWYDIVQSALEGIFFAGGMWSVSKLWQRYQRNRPETDPFNEMINRTVSCRESLPTAYQRLEIIAHELNYVRLGTRNQETIYQSPRVNAVHQLRWKIENVYDDGVEIGLKIFCYGDIYAINHYKRWVKQLETTIVTLIETGEADIDALEREYKSYIKFENPTRAITTAIGMSVAFSGIIVSPIFVVELMELTGASGALRFFILVCAMMILIPIVGLILPVAVARYIFRA